MLARTGTRADLERANFLFEPKIDGIRALCVKREGVRFFNRSGRDVSNRYPELDFGEALRAETCVLDGEIVLYNAQGHPDFSGLMKRHLGTGMLRTRDRALRYAVFDILEKDGTDLTGLPLEERKAMLREVAGDHPNLELMVYTGDGPKLWAFIQRRGLEGVIAKKASSTYRPGRRSRDWRKVKSFDTLDAVIVGYTSELRAVSALALAAHDGTELRFIGKVGTGFNREDVETLRDLLASERVDVPPVAAPPEYRDVTWVAPKYVCEVRYLEFGSQGMLRNPSFLRLRPDKSPDACQLEIENV